MSEQQEPKKESLKDKVSALEEKIAELQQFIKILGQRTGYHVKFKETE